MLSTLMVLLQEGVNPTAGSPVTPTQVPQQPQMGWDVFILPVALFAIFYFLVFRPQRKQQKQRMAMLSEMKKGDSVLTTGGMIGKIVNLKDDEITLEVDENVRIRFSRGAVAQVLDAQEKNKELVNSK